MAKYSLEFKLEVVHEYLNGEGSYDYIAKKHNMPACSRIKEWVAVFRELGKEGLMRVNSQSKCNSTKRLHLS